MVLIGDRDIRDKLRFAHSLSRKWRSLLEPGARGGRAPQRLSPRSVQRPAHRRMVVVRGEVVAAVEFQAVVIGIPDIEKKRVGNAVAAGPALDVLEIAAR